MSASRKSSFVSGEISAKFQSHFIKRGGRNHGIMQSKKSPDSITSSRDSTDSGSSGSGSFPGSRDSSSSPATDPSALPIQRNRPGWLIGADGIKPSPFSNSNVPTLSACSTSPLLKGQPPTQPCFPPAATSAATEPAPPTEQNKSGRLAGAPVVQKKKSPRYLTWDEIIGDELSPPTKFDLPMLSGCSPPDLFEERLTPKSNATTPISSTELFPDTAGTQGYRLTVLTIPPKSASQDSDDSDSYQITSEEITSPESRMRCKQEYDSDNLRFQQLSRMMSGLQAQYIAYIALFKKERRRSLRSGALGKSDDKIEQNIMKSIRDPVHKTMRKELNYLHVKLRHLSRMISKYDGKISTVP